MDTFSKKRWRVLATFTAVVAGVLAGSVGADAGASEEIAASSLASEAATAQVQEVETLVTGLEAPWDAAFLPDGSALVTERQHQAAERHINW